MSVAQRISEAEYEQMVWSDQDRQWELHDGLLVEKPGMTWNHSRMVMRLGHLLMNQLDLHQFHVFFEGRVRRTTATIFMPDLLVVPVAYGEGLIDQPDKLAIVSQPLPLVVEVWSRSTGDHDIDEKLPDYQRRGDLEIWYLHPYKRSLTAWRRQPDGSYLETVYRDGIIRPAELPGVAIDLAALFAP